MKKPQHSAQTPMGGTGDGTGMKIILGIVVFLFLIGLIIFIFALFSGQLQTATAGSASGSFVNQSILFTNGTGSPTSVANLSGVSLSSVEVTVCS